MAGEAILIVDDTAVHLKLTRILLASEGYQVFTAASAEEALDVLKQHRLQLVLTDLHLPGMDGLELARRIKTDEHTRDIFVVALSGFSCPEEEEEALRAGCDACLSKPIDTRAFGRQVGEFLERRGVPARPANSSAADALSDSALLPLRRRFLDESTAQARQWILDLDGELDAERAARAVHQWIGAAGLLGYPDIGEMARGLEVAFRARPMDTGEIREALDEVLRAFAARQAERKPET